MNIKHPSFIEFEIGTYCNRTCSWCPNTLNSRGSEKNHVTPALWQGFLRDLAAAHYQGILAIHNYNEPLLDPNVFDRIKDARDIAPEAKLVVFTNGDPLNKVMLERLKALSIHELRITLYPKENREGALTPYVLDKLFKRINMSLSDFTLTKTERGLEYQGTQDNLDFLIIMPIIENYTNRASSVNQTKVVIRTEPCFLPEHSVAIDYLGNFKLCCQVQDVLDDDVYNIGNIGTDGFFSVWEGYKLNAIRAKLKNSDFRALKYCSECDHSKDYSPILEAE